MQEFAALLLYFAAVPPLARGRRVLLPGAASPRPVESAGAVPTMPRPPFRRVPRCIHALAVSWAAHHGTGTGDREGRFQPGGPLPGRRLPSCRAAVRAAGMGYLSPRRVAACNDYPGHLPRADDSSTGPATPASLPSVPGGR
ncbi:MAG: hypothetical protein ACLSAF_07770 [Intestinimonas sp.]